MSSVYRLFIVALGVPALVVSMFVFAAEQTNSSLGQVVLPDPVLPQQARQCVEPVELMRREHMKFLLHQRDATVIDGIRTKKYSLVGCIECHNPTPASGQAVHYENPEHFCAGCHLFTGVKIDCFGCHADRPPGPA